MAAKHGIGIGCAGVWDKEGIGGGDGSYNTDAGARMNL